MVYPRHRGNLRSPLSLFFFSSRRRHTRCSGVSWARRCVQETVQCVLPEETLEERVIAIFIGNERSLGGEFQPCPKARIDDGLMDLCFVRAGTGESYLRLFRSVR